MFGRIPLWSPPVLDFCSLGDFFFITKSFSLLVIGLFKLFLFYSVLADCTLLEIHLFLLCCPISWHIIICSILLWFFFFFFCILVLVVISPLSLLFFFLFHFLFCLFGYSFFFMSLAKNFSILFMISKNYVLGRTRWQRSRWTWSTSLSTDTSEIHLQTQKCMQNTSWEWTGVYLTKGKEYRVTQNSIGWRK